MENKEIEEIKNSDGMAKEENIKVWMNFDFGFSGDFENMYVFLDRIKAVECGNEAAHFELKPVPNYIEALKKDIAKNVKLNKNDRIHVVISFKGKLQAGFLYGGRKRAQWTGYAIDEQPGIVDIL